MSSCVVPVCQSGYGSKNKFPEGIGKHRFPKDPRMKELWIKAIPRADWKPTTHSRVCSLHFDKSDFKVDRDDSNKFRNRGELKIRQLRKNAIPRVFPGCPSYLSVKKAPERSTTSTSSVRRQLLIEKAERDAEEFLGSDKTASFEELISKLPKDFPSPWNITTSRSQGTLLLEEVAFDGDGKPFFKFSLIIREDLSFEMFVWDVKVSSSRVKHITKEQKITRHSDVENILTILNCLSEEAPSKSDVVEDCIKKLEKLAESDQTSDAQFTDKIIFLSEQLKLSVSSSHSLKYSANLTLTAMTWQKTSPALYRLIKSDGRLSLPSVSYLRRLSNAYHLESGLSSATVSYLSERVKALTDQEKIVSLQIDEASCNSQICSLIAASLNVQTFSCNLHCLLFTV
jgi:hypothetical protein